MLKYSGESARVTHETAQAPPLDHRYANCARALYTECPILTEKYFTHRFFDEREESLVFSTIILLDYVEFQVNERHYLFQTRIYRDNNSN